MTSERKIRANRANARASTAPKTQHGRSHAARNALRHALTLPVFSPGRRSANARAENSRDGHRRRKTGTRPPHCERPTAAWNSPQRAPASSLTRTAGRLSNGKQLFLTVANGALSQNSIWVRTRSARGRAADPALGSFAFLAGRVAPITFATANLFVCS